MILPFRKFTREQLLESFGMGLLRRHGTESGQRLHAFILDAYDDGECADAESAQEFISVCTAVFKDMEADKVAEEK
jgi:hypothetical protein